jgi:hypothetical protein
MTFFLGILGLVLQARERFDSTQIDTEARAGVFRDFSPAKARLEMTFLLGFCLVEDL